MSPVARRRTVLGALAALVALSLVPFAARGQDAGRPPPGLFYPRTVIVVRHAEKAAEPADNPVLDERGRARAERLAALLRHSGVTHLFASEYQRTQETLRPLAGAVGASVTTVSARDARALLSALDNLPRNSVAVVAGHSNTVGPIVAALAPGSLQVKQARASLELTEADYDRVFCVTRWGPEAADASVLELRY
jgi:phosphohistidine phosphatase SixA